MSKLFESVLTLVKLIELLESSNVRNKWFSKHLILETIVKVNKEGLIKVISTVPSDMNFRKLHIITPSDFSNSLRVTHDLRRDSIGNLNRKTSFPT